MRSVHTGIDAVLAHVEDGVGVVTLNRPERKNAVTPEMLDALAIVFAEFDRDPEVRAILLTGAGDAFCAGGDVAKFAARGGDVAGAEETEQQWRDRRIARQSGTVGRLHMMDTPSIAVLSGAVAGAGLGLALACDLRVGCAETLITTAFVKVGLSGDFGTNWLLSRLVGPSRALRLMLLSERIGGPQAFGFGLLDWLVPRAELTAVALDLAATIAAAPSTAVRAIEANLREAPELDLEEAMRREITRYRECAAGPDHRDAVQAFARSRADSSSRPGIGRG